MQSFPQKSNSTTDFTRLPHLAAIPCDHTVVISLHGKYFYKTQKIVSYDWQYKGHVRDGYTRTAYMWLLAQML